MDVLAYCKKCPECVVVTGGGQQHRQPLHPIPIQRGLSKLLASISWSYRVLRVVTNMWSSSTFTKWPMVYAVRDQKTERITELLCEEVVPFFGVPEALLLDRGANLSHLMLDICKSLGITKLNTTAYHPECDSMVERFSRTLKLMLRKRAAQYGTQWDKHLPGVLWAYCNTPLDTTGEKPSFYLGGTVNLQVRLLCYPQPVLSQQQ